VEEKGCRKKRAGFRAFTFFPPPSHFSFIRVKALVSFLVQAVYNVAFVAFFAIAGPYLLYRLWRRGKLLPQFGQRFGFYAPEVRARLRSDLWIHAVSVGEVNIALVLIRRLRELEPNLRIVVSTTTATGFKVAQSQLVDARTTVIYNPLDFLGSVASAFNAIRPRRLILIESEIWPNYLWCARRRRIPVYLVNARLSARSEERYRRMRWLLSPLLREIALVFAQDTVDVTRLTQAGFAPETIFNLGSLKYDVAALDSHDEKDVSAWWNRSGWDEKDVVLLGGSTHPGEEEVLARIYLGLRAEFPRLRLLLAPRHAERGAAVRDACEKLGLRAVLRSELAAATQPLANGSTPDAVVVNSTGELRALYQRATLAFVGKSLRGHGGQNFLEAARAGMPVVVGPNMQNFAVATREFLQCDALVQVSDEFELATALRGLLESETLRTELGRRTRATFEAKLNAARRTAAAIAQSLAADGAAGRADRRS
jgi:3-deoxy-D-manno-octulosonic-acid transferase